jgi:excisionase family DNA binding protein
MRGRSRGAVEIQSTKSLRPKGTEEMTKNSQLDLHAAAKVAGCSRSTLRRAIKGGRISGNKEASGRWRIERAELARFVDDQRAAHDQTHSFQDESQ